MTRDKIANFLDIKDRQEIVFVRGTTEAINLVARHAPFIAGFTSLLFALHPVQTQAVTYLVQRYMSLAALFYLLSIFLYVKWRLASLEVRRVGAKGFGGMLVGLYLLSLAALLLGLKTKEVCLTLPLALGLYEFLFFEGKRATRLLWLLPFLLATLIVPLSLLELANLNKPLSEILRQISRKSFIATEATSREYLLTQFAVLATYLRLLILPIHQNLDYDYPVYRSFFAPAVFLSFVLLAAIIGLTAYLLYRYRRREPAVRLVAFGVWLFFLGPAVESTRMPMIHVINEHRLYLATAGFFTALTTGIFWGAAKWEARRPALSGAVMLLLLALAGVYGLATHLRNQVWQSEITLWEDVIKKSPRKARPYDELGLAYARQGRFSEAVPLYRQAIALNPHFATYYSNLGVAYGSLGDPEKARQMFEQALLVDPGNANVHNNLGVLYLRQKRLKEGEEMFRRDMAISPGDAVAQKNLKLLQGRPSP